MGVAAMGVSFGADLSLAPSDFAPVVARRDVVDAVGIVRVVNRPRLDSADLKSSLNRTNRLLS